MNRINYSPSDLSVGIGDIRDGPGLGLEPPEYEDSAIGELDLLTPGGGMSSAAWSAGVLAVDGLSAGVLSTDGLSTDGLSEGFLDVDGLSEGLDVDGLSEGLDVEGVFPLDVDGLSDGVFVLDVDGVFALDVEADALSVDVLAPGDLAVKYLKIN